MDDSSALLPRSHKSLQINETNEQTVSWNHPISIRIYFPIVAHAFGIEHNGNLLYEFWLYYSTNWFMDKIYLFVSQISSVVFIFMVFIFNEHCEMVERRVWLTRFYFEYCMSGDRKLHGFHFCYSSNYFTQFFFTFFFN